MAHGSRNWLRRIAFGLLYVCALALFAAAAGFFVTLFLPLMELAERHPILSYSVGGVVLMKLLLPAMKKWKTFVAGALLVGLGIFHSVWPQRMSLDWPGATLLLAGVLLWFSGRLDVLLSYIKKLKLGELEIELQERLSDLSANIEQLDEETPRNDARRVQRNAQNTASTEVEAAILDLASRDREAALLRLGIEIEKELGLLSRSLGLESPGTWRQSVDALGRASVLEPALAKALIEFRDIRNRVIHSGLRGPVRQSMLTRAIDDGLKLLRHLKTIAR